MFCFCCFCLLFLMRSAPLKPRRLILLSVVTTVCKNTLFSILPQDEKLPCQAVYLLLCLLPFCSPQYKKRRFLLIGNFSIAAACFTSARLPNSSIFRLLIFNEPLQIRLPQPCHIRTRYKTNLLLDRYTATFLFSAYEFLFTSVTDDFRKIEIEGKCGSVKSLRAISESALKALSRRSRRRSHRPHFYIKLKLIYYQIYDIIKKLTPKLYNRK